MRLSTVGQARLSQVLLKMGIENALMAADKTQRMVSALTFFIVIPQR
jgi:hypothetical protein